MAKNTHAKVTKTEELKSEVAYRVLSFRKTNSHTGDSQRFTPSWSFHLLRQLVLESSTFAGQDFFLNFTKVKVHLMPSNLGKIIIVNFHDSKT